MSSPQDPFAPPSDGDQPGGQQHQSGSQPPAYGSQPPAYGAQPPAYGAAPGYGAQPAAYGPPPAQGYGGGPAYPKNSLGVWSIVLAGIAFFCAGPVASIPGVILGHLALKANKEQTANNYGLSMAGVIINWVVTVMWLVGLIWFFGFGGLDWYMGLLEESVSTTY